MAGKGKAQDTFRMKAPWIMALLMRDFPALSLDDAAAIVGNLGHESGGFASLQEIKPTVAGSKGGYGWAQWTGPRRRAYEAWCKERGFSPAEDQANYGYLVVELKGSEKAAIGKTVNAKGLAAKVKAFELAFERAGVKHYDSRNRWAAIAIDAWHDAGGHPTLPAWSLGGAVKPAAPKPAEKPQDAREAPAAPSPVETPSPRPAATEAGKAGDNQAARPMDRPADRNAARSVLAIVAAIVLTAVAALLGLAKDATPAPALVMVCGPFKAVAKALAEAGGQVPVSSGLTRNGNALTIFATPDGQTFTVVVAGAEGGACIMDTGTGWEIWQIDRGEPS